MTNGAPSESSIAPAIAMENVRKRLGHRLGKLVEFSIGDFTVIEGEMVAIVGPSGSGKTTLLRVIAGLTHVDSGKVQVAGKDLHEFTEGALDRFRGKSVGIVFQDFNLLNPLSCGDNLRIALRLARAFPKAAWQERVEAALADVGLTSHARSMPASLSAGERQRLAIARALINEAPILLADEPTGNLDSQNADCVLNQLRRAVGNGKRSCVVVTHDAGVAKRCDRVIASESWIRKTESAS